MAGKYSPFRILMWAIMLIFALYVVLPLVIVVLQSFNPRITLIPQEFTLRWYQMRTGGLLPALGASLMISVPAVITGILVSLPLAYATTHYEFRGKAFIRQMLVLPIIIPGVVLGLAYLQLLNSTPLRDMHPAFVLILVHTIIVIPYAARPIIAGFETIDPAIEEASATLGARPFSTFLKIILPLLVPAILSGGILGFARSINDFIITLFLIQPGFVPLSVQVFQTTQFGLPQVTAALGSILLLFSLIFVTAAEAILRLETRR
ncbi:ABC-type spermidine/putrescine transport system, permease component II [Hoeflea sp. IMCC20628]|uniref:ABC transporter permease n=1 Tax=Hoeflea sp. IMCC20628 TaxID=1620421 RepID=UPI00063BD401|nr:ABC transporter permease [Hoeflea sp. IMCC20628]AKH99694.1 ABC-type spermidine/putrescine transport system, permease component II [Hoeflea sp. IMCC20628]